MVRPFKDSVRIFLNCRKVANFWVELKINYFIKSEREKIEQSNWNWSLKLQHLVLSACIVYFDKFLYVFLDVCVKILFTSMTVLIHRWWRYSTDKKVQKNSLICIIESSTNDCNITLYQHLIDFTLPKTINSCQKFKHFYRSKVLLLLGKLDVSYWTNWKRHY